jgi:hypothetical protein
MKVLYVKNVSFPVKRYFVVESSEKASIVEKSYNRT